MHPSINPLQLYYRRVLVVCIKYHPMYRREDLVLNFPHKFGRGIIFSFSAQFHRYERDDLVLGGIKSFPNIVGKKVYLVTFYPKPGIK